MLDRLIGAYLVEKGMITRSQLVQAYKKQESERAKLGVIAVAEKMMTIAQAEQVNMLQSSMDKRFGDIAVEKGYLSEAQVQRLLGLQGNTYLTFLQVMVDLGLMTMEQLEKAEEEYKRENAFTETDMVTLKSGEVDKCVSIFLNIEDPVYNALFSMGVKNLYRLVDNHIYIGKAYPMKAIKDEVLGYQGFHGTQQAVVAISGKYDDARKMAIAYTKEEFIETKEDALDAVCELINCVNGLYASDQSRGDAKIELEPPNFSVNFAQVSSDDMYVLPVYICGGEVKYIVAVSKDVSIG